MAKTQFTWIPIYTEMAHAILQYRTRQGELIQVLLDLQSSSLPVGGIQDQMNKGVQTLMKEIDPFTFFTAFNRKTTNQNRMKILERLKQFFQLSSPMPVDFDGVPLANAQNSWFFTPSVPEIVNALKLAYDAPRGRSEQAVSHAQGYGADTVFEQHWKPTMKELSAWCRS